MSVDALVQVFRDHRKVPPGVQAVLIALAWRTPQGRDTTAPTSYRDLATLTRQHPGTVRRNLLEAVSSGEVEVVWAKPGQPSRYRVNRGEWYVPGTSADLEAALGIVDPAHSARARSDEGYQMELHDARTSHTTTRGDRAHDDDPLRIKERKEEVGPLADLTARLRERGHIE